MRLFLLLVCRLSFDVSKKQTKNIENFELIQLFIM